MNTNYDLRPNTTRGDNVHLHFIDYLKVIAFSSVVISHEFSLERNDFFKIPIFNLSVFHPLQVFLTTGGGGVVLFFLVSGYLITKSIQHETSIEFLVRRSFRIFPLYWSVIVLFLLTKNLNIGISDGFGAFTLLGDFWNVPHILGGIDWSLRIEIVFYLLAFSVLGLFEFDSKNDNLPILLMVIILVFSLLCPQYPDEWNRGYPAIFMPLFCPGIVCALHENRKNYLLTLFGLVAPVAISIRKAYEFRPDLINLGFITYILLALVFFLTGWLLRNKIPTIKAIRFFAGISYPIYLFHSWLLPDLARYTPKAIALVLTIFFCWLSSILIERPFIKLSRRLTRAT